MPYEGLVVTKLSRGEAEPLGWKRGEVRALLRYIDAALASEMPCAGLVAEADGPSVTVSLRDETA